MAQDPKNEAAAIREPDPTSDADNPERDVGILDIALVIAENAWLLIVVPVLVGLVALGNAFTIPETFTASTKILPPQQQQSSLAAALTQVGGVAAGLANFGGLAKADPALIYVSMIKIGRAHV